MPDIDHHRKAAISIYFLNRKDQKWLLSRLPENDAARIISSLDELRSLAVPRDQITKKTILSYLDIPLDDDLYGLLTEILNKDSALLVDFINEEPSWLGIFLMNEYPPLFDSTFRNRLSRHKFGGADQVPGKNLSGLTARARLSILKSTQQELMKKYLDAQADASNFSGIMEKYEAVGERD